jgi:hypothetical protein
MEIKKMKIYCDGARFYGDQISRIEQGFRDLGYEITEFITEADLIYSNNPSDSRAQIIRDKINGKLKSNCKIIACILDVPVHLIKNENFLSEMNDIRMQLSLVDAVVSISQYTHDSVKKYYGFNSTVIHNPIKPITKLNLERKKSFGVIVGRKFDPNKNVIQAIHAMQILGVPECQVYMVGSESIGWGDFVGVQSDENLNKIYL